MAKTKLIPHNQLSQVNSTETDSENALVTTLHQLESDTELKSFIYQQINDFSPYITPETQVMVVARDPHAAYEDENHVLHEHLTEDDIDEAGKPHEYKFRISIILQETEGSLEAEGFGDDIYDAILYAKQALLQRLVEIQDEVESPQERLNAIELARNSTQLH